MEQPQAATTRRGEQCSPAQQPAQPRIPERMCVACRAKKTKPELVRLVQSQGVVGIDFSGKSQCRGVYLCRDTACLERARKQKQLERAFRRAMEPTLWTQLQEAVSHDTAT